VATECEKELWASWGHWEVGIGSGQPGGMQQAFAILSRVTHPPILLGTSSFTAAGWQASFYPKGPVDWFVMAFQW
jgi:hypothetical protein